MARENFNDFLAFLAVAREGSFTRAAAQLGVSQSALSHTIRQLEARLGIRLLMRTTRSVSPTEAGERLLNSLRPHFEQIEIEIAALSALRDKPSGTIRLTGTDFSFNSVVWPRLKEFLLRYPDIRVEMINDYGLSDIVAERYDAGIRLGEQVAKDMISVRVGPDIRFAVVGSPAYFKKRSKPKTPQDLLGHNCMTLRLPTHGGLYAWEFENDGHETRVRVDGQVVSNTIYQILDAALAGVGLGHMPEEMILQHVAKGRLVRVLEDWCPLWAGYNLFYPSRRQSSPAFALLVETLRYRGK